ncbi:MAG: DUF481 domain-containing protein [Thermoanaerobaculia bacterium]|nr:DUF481 domain-containing protein [Thermoanaerobaculia bacterium]
MKLESIGIVLLSMLLAIPAAAEELETDGWRLDLGLSYLATTGNSETSSLGFTSEWEKLDDRWRYLAGLEAQQAEEEGEQTAERYAAFGRADWKISERLAVTSGWQGEQNRFAGIDFRSTTDLGISWKALAREDWKIDTVASATWNYEDQIQADSGSNAGLLLMARSRYQLSENASTTQMVRLEPNVENFDDFRVDARLGLKTSVTQAIGLNVSYEIRYDAEPVPGFEDTDTLATVALVLNLRNLEEQ